MHEEHGVSIRPRLYCACFVAAHLPLARPKADEEIIDALNELVSNHPAIGFWQAHHRLRRAGRGITSAYTGSTPPWGSISGGEPRNDFRHALNSNSSSQQRRIRSGAWTSCMTASGMVVRSGC